MIEVPWWALSPSPFTLAYLAALALYAERKMIEGPWRGRGARFYIRRFAEGAFLVGLVQMPFDIAWCFAQQLRFGHLYPGDFSLFYSIGRDLAIIALCILESYDSTLWRLRFGKASLSLTLLMLLFVAAWFTFAPDQSWTDWTYAIRSGSGHVLESFLVSHAAGKAIVGCLFISLWREPPQKAHKA